MIPLTPRFVVVLSFLAIFAKGLQAGDIESGAAPGARLILAGSGEGETAFALALQPALDSFLPAQPHDHVILVDTSASQVGDHRRQAFAVLKELLAALPDTDRVGVFAVDVGASPMTSGWTTPSAATREALPKLNRRVPLGATNLIKALQTAAREFQPDRPKSIIYIGDGLSTADLIGPDELRTQCQELRNSRIAVHSYAVGPRTDLQLLGVLAVQTGGVLFVDKAHELKDKPAVAARAMAVAVDASILYPTAMTVEPTLGEILPEQPLPLRADRETIYLGSARIPAKVNVTVRVPDSAAMKWTAELATAERNQSHLSAVYRQAETMAGINNFFAGSEMLTASRLAFDQQLGGLVQAGAVAVQRRNLKQVEAVAATLKDLDPQNADAKALQTKLTELKAKAGKTRVIAIAQAPAADEPSLLDNPKVGAPPVPQPPAAQPGAPSATAQATSLLGEEEKRREIKGQQLAQEVNTTINGVRKIAQDDPDAALSILKRTIGLVSPATDINPDLRQRLMKQLENVRAEVTSQQEVAQVRRIQAQEELAKREAQQRLIEQAQRDEDKLDQLIDRVRGLMNEGNHGNDDAYEQAEAVARIATDLQPDSGVTAAALFNAEAAGQLRKAFRLRSLRADKFLETLYQVELAHVPFPDEPPVLWPPAEVWKALTERRRKWASVDLHKNSVAEERIQRALSDTTEIEFVDTPLKEAMSFLSDLHNITIILDEAALMEDGINTDEPINQILSGITLRSALKIILEKLSLTYIIEDEVMKITTQVKADDKRTTRVYPVGDLVIPIRTPLSGGLGQGFGGIGGFGGQGGFGNGGQFGLGGSGYGGVQGGGGFGGGGLGGGF